MSFSDSDLNSNDSNISPRTLAKKIESNRRFFQSKKALTLVMEAFNNSKNQKVSEKASQAKILRRLLNECIIPDFEGLDHLETDNIQVIDPIARHRIRVNNKNNKFIVKRYFTDTFDLIIFCKDLLRTTSTNSMALEQDLAIMAELMRLICMTLEFGLWDIKDSHQLIKKFFLKTEQLHKQEEYINQRKQGFKPEVYENLMICKEHSACILVQIITFINDEWLFFKLKQRDAGVLENLGSLASGLVNTIQLKKEKAASDSNVMFNENKYFYSFFSYIMFNYLLYTLKKGGRILSTWRYRRAIYHLLMYIYDYHQDPFSLSCKLLKNGYLGYYLTENIEQDYIDEGEKLGEDLSEMIELYIKMRNQEQREINILDNSRILKNLDGGVDSEQGSSGEEADEMTDSKVGDERGENEARLENSTGELFTRLEVLIGLQDETFATRLMLTEKTIPFLLINLLDEIQKTLKGEMAEEVFVRGLKILFQLTKGNYLAQAQITLDPAWKHLESLLSGSSQRENGVLTLIYLSELFIRDNKVLHINQNFTSRLIKMFRHYFTEFFSDFVKKKSTTASNIVYLFMFQRLLAILMKNKSIEEYLRKPYRLLIVKTLHDMVCRFALPLMINNQLEAAECYEPKLIKKHWNFENCFSLSALMMLSGEHLRSMLMDLSLSLLKLYNLACSDYYPGEFNADIKEVLPSEDLSCFDYLLEFPEGIIFKSEILVTYSNFKIFANSSRILGAYTKAEVSPFRQDTFDDYLPEDHSNQIPKIIISELRKFSSLNFESYEQEDLIDYLLRGICQMILKYCKGVEFYADICNKETVVNKFTKYLQQILNELYNVRRQVQHMRDMDYRKRANARKNVGFKSSFRNELLNSTIPPLMTSLNMMFEGSKYEYIKNKYQLREVFRDKKEMKVVNQLLACEASFVTSKNFKQEPSTEDKASKKKDDSEDMQEEVPGKENEDIHAKRLRGLVKYYKKVKISYIKDISKNLFYTILQSKMEENNQKNLVSYILSALHMIQLDVKSELSFWQDTHSLNLLIFLNNCLYWCSSTRKAMHGYLSENVNHMENLISAVYKGMRDSFAILAFSPFDNKSWEVIYSKYYIFSSFIQGLCKENCQEFKEYLGEFRPNLKSVEHQKRNLPLILDLENLLIKYLLFSGVSSNTTSKILQSDHIVMIPTLERLFRCLIDMLTGPSRKNQLKTYTIGTQIWLNILTRIIENFDSEYYYLVDITLDYLLSLLEGNNGRILQFFAAAFDIPVMYGIMVKMIVTLRDRIENKNFGIRKRKSKRRRKKVANIFHKSEKSSNRKRKQVAVSHTSSNALAALEVMKSQVGSKKESSYHPNSEAIGLFSTTDHDGSIPEKLDWEDEDKFQSNWEDLTEMYKTDAFEGHIALKCAIKIYRFLNRVAYISRKYQIYFDKKEKDLEEKFADFGFKREEIETGQAKLKGKAKSDDELIVYYFMKSITAKIEILDNQKDPEIFIFPKPPCCFYLKKKTILEFQETCNIENTEAKLSDMFDSFQMFYREMINYQQFRAKYPIFSSITTDGAFAKAQLFCWLLALGLNITYLFQVYYLDKQALIDDISVVYFLMGSTWLLIFVATFMAICWFITNYSIVWVNEMARFRKKNPYKNPKSIINFLQISILKSIFLQTEVISFIIHIVLGVLGIAFSPIFQVRPKLSNFTLFLIFSIFALFSLLLPFFLCFITCTLL